jgi:cytoskeleton protein RodZ
MQSVGQKLRGARLALGISLERVSANTRIPTKILQAIEAGDWTGFHSAFLYRSFIRQFAQEVRLSPTDVEAEIQESASRIAEPPMPGQNSYQPKIPALNLGRPVKVRWAYSLGSLFVTLVLCSGIHALWQSSERSSKVSASAAPVPPLANVRSARANEIHGFRIELSAIERTWLSIRDDGRQVFNGVLSASQTKVLVAQKTARIRAANAGAVQVVFNGRTLGPLGARGQVATVVFTPSGYKIFEPSARIAPVEFIPSGE